MGRVTRVRQRSRRGGGRKKKKPQVATPATVLQPAGTGVAKPLPPAPAPVTFLAPCDTCFMRTHGTITMCNWKLVDFAGVAQDAYKCMACEALHGQQTLLSVKDFSAKCLDSPVLYGRYVMHRASLYTQ